MLNAVETVNNYQLDHVISTIKKALGSIKHKNITILGLAFKPDTDDIRDSVSIKLIAKLLNSDANIKVHDPKAIENTRSIFGDRITYTDSLVEALKNSECAVILTNWKMYHSLKNKHVNKMKRRIIVDTRRMLKEHNLNITYYPIGIG